MAVEIRRTDGAHAREVIEELADAYMAGYADDPDIGHSIYERSAFVERTTRQSHRPGFVLVTAHHDDGTWAGFSFGFPFEAGRWWAGDHGSDPPLDLVAVAKFAVIELVTLPSARGQGLATRLMAELLRSRPEPYATLLADQQGHARDIYDRWGWRHAATLYPAPDVPALDALVLELGGERAWPEDAAGV